MDVERADVRSLLENEEFIGDITRAIIEDRDIMEELVEDVADELEDLIEDDPEIGRRIIEVAMAGKDPKKVPERVKLSVEEMPIKQRILSAAMENPHFHKKVVAYLVKGMR